MLVDRLGIHPVPAARAVRGLLCLALGLLASFSASTLWAQDVHGDLPPTPSMAASVTEDGDLIVDWSPILRDWGRRPLRAQLELRRAENAYASGDRSAALEHLDRATQEDPRNARVWFLRSRVHLLEADPLFLSDWLSGMRALLGNYQEQSRWSSRILVKLDLVLGLALIWIVLVLLLRYLPFLHHQLRSQTQGEHHTEGRGLLLWLPALAPLTLLLGLIPSLCLGFWIVWLYTGRRERLVLGCFLLFMAAQGPWSARLAAPLAGTANGSLPSLVQRAAKETPGPALEAELEAAAEANPGSTPLEFARGLFEARQGHFNGSSKRFQEVLRLDPKDARATNNLANNHYYRGDYDRAVSGYQRSASLDPLEGSTHYNLAQAYIKKLFFKEGGEHMQQASRAGFELGDPAHRLPTGAVYYQSPGASDSWVLAWRQTTPVLLPFDLLTPYSRWLGVPADHVPFWFAATLLLALLSLKLVPREKLVFECANCGVLSCRRCSGEHEGNVLCRGCHGTTKRARSEVVLTTLLRNRRRATEFSFHTRVRRLNSWLFGAGEIYNGLRRRGVLVAILLAWCLAEILHPETLLPGPWESIENLDPLSPARIAPLVGLALIFLFARFGRSAWRSRSFHLHPASMVRLADLMDGRGEKRLKA